ncbi:hypothetical protein BH09DEP1_BH09DEP1_5970 [soil metagenome]
MKWKSFDMKTMFSTQGCVETHMVSAPKACIEPKTLIYNDKSLYIKHNSKPRCKKSGLLVAAREMPNILYKLLQIENMSAIILMKIKLGEDQWHARGRLPNLLPVLSY